MAVSIEKSLVLLMYLFLDWWRLAQTKLLPFPEHWIVPLAARQSNDCRLGPVLEVLE